MKLHFSISKISILQLYFCPLLQKLWILNTCYLRKVLHSNLLYKSHEIYLKLMRARKIRKLNIERTVNKKQQKI